MNRVRAALSNRTVVGTVQVLIVVMLLGVAVALVRLQSHVQTEGGKVEAINNLLGNTCEAASFRELRRDGLIEECRLARKGTLPQDIPKAVISDPAQVTESPDVIPDDGNATKADVQPVPVPPTSAQVQDAVADYFDIHPLPSTPAYQRAIQRSVEDYLTLHPPQPGPGPTGRQIESAVRTALLANPPSDGTDGTNGSNGSDGVSVASASTDGCDVVFTYSDGRTSRVGPLCGPPPSSDDIKAAVAAYCDANGSCAGPQGPPGEPGVVATDDDCTPTDGEFVSDVSIDYDRANKVITLSCTTSPLVPGLRTSNR